MKLIRFVTIATAVGLPISAVPLTLSAGQAGPATIAAAATTAVSPWTPFVTLFGSLISAGLNGKKDDAKKALNTNKAKMEDQSQLIAPWPQMLDASRAIRENSIRLAMEVKFLRQLGQVDEESWDYLTADIASLKSDYEKFFSNKDYKPMLDSYSEPLQDNGRRAFAAIERTLHYPRKDAASRKKALDDIAPETDKIVDASFLGEYYTIGEAKYLVKQYKTLTSQINQKPGSGKEQSSDSTSNNTAAQTRHHVQLASLRLTREEGQSLLPTLAQSDAPKSKDETAQGSIPAPPDIVNLTEPPSWMARTVNQAREKYRASWGETLAGGLGGAAIGFAGILLLTLVSRSKLSPRNAAQLDALSRSVAFRADAEKDVASEIAALHLDLSSELLRRAAQSSKTESVNVTHDSDAATYEESLNQIRAFRDKLKKANLI
jgi:hypothetical protein